MFSWFIAWRYACSRFITFAAFLLVSLSVAILIILLGVMEGFRTEMIEQDDQESVKWLRMYVALNL